MIPHRLNTNFQFSDLSLNINVLRVACLLYVLFQGGGGFFGKIFGGGGSEDAADLFIQVVFNFQIS